MPIRILPVDGQPHDRVDRAGRCPLGEMQPLKISRARGRADWRFEAPIAVFFQDILHDGARLGERHVAIFDIGIISGRRVLGKSLFAVLMEGGADKIIFDGELLQKPANSDRSR